MEKEIELSFNEKCDKVLRYLAEIANSETQVQYLTSLNQLVADTGVNLNDPVINFLERHKGFIYMPRNEPYIQISSPGLAFISHSSFVQEQLKLETEGKLKWYETENAKQIFDDYPIVKKQRNRSYIIVVITILMTIVSTWIAVAQYLKCK